MTFQAPSTSSLTAALDEYTENLKRAGIVASNEERNGFYFGWVAAGGSVMSDQPPRNYETDQTS